MSKPARVCSRPGCPELINPATGQCANGHGRHRNQPWSQDRNRQQQHIFRTAVLYRDGYRCTRCGHHDPTGRSLDAHHIRKGNNPAAGVTLCNDKANGCHAAVDASAR